MSDDCIGASREDILAMMDFYLNKDEMYKHCSYCGFVYQGQGIGVRDYSVPVIDINRLTGSTRLPIGIDDGFKLTSGACPGCVESELENKILDGGK